MKNYLKKCSVKFIIFSLLAPALMLVFLGSIPASACGCGLLLTSSDAGIWQYGSDSLEQSFINLEGGAEKLIISLDIKKTSRDAVLVIPIPAEPNLVYADILSETPSFFGYDVSKRAQENLSHIRDSLLATQIYPIIPMIVKTFTESTYGVSNIMVPTQAGRAPDGITVYQHLEKNGMIAEVLSATNSSSLYNYLTNKGLKIERDSVPIFRDYIRKDFSFVVSWINPSITDVAARGILMNFPANKIFYPLKPGSAYSGSGMQKTINVVGHVTPELYSNIKDSTKVGYYYSDSGSTLKDFFTTDQGFNFTRITINAKPSKLTQDLYISEKTPLKILNAQFINFYPLIYGLILLVIISLISTYLVIKLLLSQTQTKPSLLKLSVANCLTLIGTIVSSFIFLKEKRFKYVILFSLTFVVITLISWCLLYSLY